MNGPNTLASFRLFSLTLFTLSATTVFGNENKILRHHVGASYLVTRYNVSSETWGFSYHFRKYHPLSIGLHYSFQFSKNFFITSEVSTIKLRYNFYEYPTRGHYSPPLENFTSPKLGRIGQETEAKIMSISSGIDWALRSNFSPILGVGFQLGFIESKKITEERLYTKFDLDTNGNATNVESYYTYQNYTRRKHGQVSFANYKIGIQFSIVKRWKVTLAYIGQIPIHHAVFHDDQIPRKRQLSSFRFGLSFAIK